ncbi:MAG: prenyltransferase/squalene oxidase repeat-containing protein [Planctomycetota bacterium]|jgi:hypothetical protein
MPLSLQRLTWSVVVASMALSAHGHVGAGQSPAGAETVEPVETVEPDETDEALEAARTAAAKEVGFSDRDAAWIGTGVTRLLAMQEGEARDQWPYEGVYRVRGGIPVGYRVGGTSIVAMTLMQAPGLNEDPPRREAVLRAAKFVANAIDDRLMDPDYRGGYDVRGWGYAYGLRFLVRLEASGLLDRDPGLARAVARAIDFYIGGLEATEIPNVGGWNYARRGPLDVPSPAAPFMTAPCLRSLLEARAAGHEVEDGPIDRGLDSLERCRGADGTYAYSGDGRGRVDPASRPGAIGRMVAGDALLRSANRIGAEDLRRSLESFFAYWDELEVRRAQTGTHVAPYGVAPYYFMYAHGAAGEAIECLPREWRPAFRRALRGRLDQVRGEDGTWNDRIFPRSANYGTALALDAMLASIGPAIPEWRPSESDAGGNPEEVRGLKTSKGPDIPAREADDS